MVINDWAAFHRTLTIEVPYGRPVPKPTAADLDEYERRVGRRLPRSYREFIMAFGPGSFSCTLEVATPGYRDSAPKVDIDVANESYRYAEDYLEQFGVLPEARALHRRLWYFGFGGSRHFMGWDPEDVRDPADAEYAIYAVGSPCDLRLAASSFRQLVEDGGEMLFAPDPDWDEEELGPQRAFEPARLGE